jgi:hypothetical protein
MMRVRVPLFAVLLGSVGCVTVQPVRDLGQFISQTNPKVVYVIYKNRAVVGVTQPRLSGDSLFGTLAGPAEPVVVPLSHVQQIKAAQPNKRRTTLLIGGLTAFTAISVYVLSKTGEGQSCDGSYHPQDCD